MIDNFEYRVTKHFKLKELEKALLISQERMEDIVKNLDESLDYDSSLELVEALTEDEQLDKKEEITSLDKIVWIVRRAYIQGYTSALITANSAAEETLKELFKDSPKHINPEVKVKYSDLDKIAEKAERMDEEIYQIASFIKTISRSIPEDIADCDIHVFQSLCGSLELLEKITAAHSREVSLLFDDITTIAQKN